MAEEQPPGGKPIKYTYVSKESVENSKAQNASEASTRDIIKEIVSLQKETADAKQRSIAYDEQQLAMARANAEAHSEDLVINMNIKAAKKDVAKSIKKIHGLEKEQGKMMASKGGTQKKNLKILADDIALEQKTLEQKKEALQLAKKLTAQLNAAQGVLTTLGNIPIVGQLIPAQKILSAMNDSAKEHGSIWKAFKEPQTGMVIGGTVIYNLLKFIVELATQWHTWVTEIQQSTGYTAAYAEEIADNFAVIEKDVGKAWVNQKSLNAAFGELNELTGINLGLNDTMLAQFVTLKDRYKMSAQQAFKLGRLNMISAKPVKDIADSIAKSVKGVIKQTKVALNLKKIMHETANVSDYMAIVLGKTPAAIAKQLAGMKAVGAEASTILGVANGMLNFEKSINAEMQWRLMTGGEINMNSKLLHVLVFQA